MRAVENSSGLSGPIVVTNAASNPWRLTREACQGRAVAAITRNVVSPVAAAPRPGFWPDYRERPAVTSAAQGAGGGLGGLGFISHAVCPEHTSVVDRIRDAIAQANLVGVDSASAGYRAAKTFYDRESSFWTTSNPWLPSSCTRTVSEGEAALRMLNAEIAARGGVKTYESTPSSFGNGELASTIKTVAIAAAVVAGAVVLAPVVFEVVGISKMFRKAR